MSSFKRKVSAKQAAPFPGTRTYLSSTITSTGIPSLDDILGGGLPLSCSSVILAPDPHSAYGELVQKYAIAQGLAWDHRVCVVDGDPDAFVRGCMWLPPTYEYAKPTSADTDEGDDAGNDGQDTIKIAWRYKQMKQFSTTVPADVKDSEQFCHTMDLTHRIPESIVAKATKNGTLSFVDMNTADSKGPSTTRVIDQLSALLQGTPVNPPAATTRPLRIVIPAFGAFQWGDITSEDVLVFLHSLRALLRHYPFACASITLSPHASTDAWGGAGWIQKIGWFSDAAITLSAFTGDPALSAAFPSHHGLLHIHTLPAPHTLLPPSDKLSVLRGLSPSAVSAGGGSGENNLAFKCTRKRLIFETLHLDVEGGIGERRTTPSTPMDIGTHVREHSPNQTAPIPSASIAAVSVTLEASPVPAVPGATSPEVDVPSVTIEKPKKPKKRVAFHSDKPDLYDF
ncbi:hypothetical protein CCMSSC00406_0000324 [Pleurotus cornucopiae]|uniref:Uncharacterized protein n=1 Tax=Pleurotus cornucopiae TaxID=5321 RepID=A0ACB7IXI8_PLECO|nr:hypothetical protein CCMSSC00406_0000324 [Pleurotus cornucopiae]